jgi:hypothetical protein
MFGSFLPSLGRHPKSTRVEGADMVMQSNAFSGCQPKPPKIYDECSGEPVIVRQSLMQAKQIKKYQMKLKQTSSETNVTDSVRGPMGVTMSEIGPARNTPGSNTKYQTKAFSNP